MLAPSCFSASLKRPKNYFAMALRRSPPVSPKQTGGILPFLRDAMDRADDH